MVTATITVDAKLLEAIDSRAQELDLNRSQYFRRLAREDLQKVETTHPERVNGMEHETKGASR